MSVLLPYEITLLSNKDLSFRLKPCVLLPYEITLLSNINISTLSALLVLLPYEITLLSNLRTIIQVGMEGFTTLWNYTTLKPFRRLWRMRSCFTTLWNYTTLKLSLCKVNKKSVLLPYEITLLSNVIRHNKQLSQVLLPYEITLLSNQGLL